MDAGINFIDTADRYSRGESEPFDGKALKGRRENIVLTTKVHGPMGDDPNQQGNSRRWILREVGDLLRRLQTDYIDLYVVHRPAPDRHVGREQVRRRRAVDSPGKWVRHPAFEYESNSTKWT